jgi:uncharacterized membrane protein YkvA (DUF1232 family)
MSMDWVLLGLGVALLVYLALIAGLLLAGRRVDAAALARFIPDCVVLMRRLVGDEQVPLRRKLVLFALLVYLLVPIDLVPDFLPVIGQLDDVIIAALALRYALRAGGPELLRTHWPGPDRTLQLVIRLAYGTQAA